MYTDVRSLLTRVPAMALLVLVSLAQPALAQGQAVSGGGAVIGANAEAALPAVVSNSLGALWGTQDCYYGYCYPDGDRGRGRHGHRRGGHG
jgi:hypothetical protein